MAKGKSGAERLREYRQRVRDDPVKHQEYLRKERERNKKQKEKGKLKCISDLSNREQKKGQKIMEEKTAKAQNICVFNIPNLKHDMSSDTTLRTKYCVTTETLLSLPKHWMFCKK